MSKEIGFVLFAVCLFCVSCCHKPPEIPDGTRGSYIVPVVIYVHRDADQKIVADTFPDPVIIRPKDKIDFYVVNDTDKDLTDGELSDFNPPDSPFGDESNPHFPIGKVDHKKKADFLSDESKIKNGAAYGKYSYCFHGKTDEGDIPCDKSKDGRIIIIERH
jgi:hypothetical protein